MDGRRRWDAAIAFLVAVAVTAVPTGAVGAEVIVSGAVDKAVAGSVTVRIVVDSSAGGWIRDDNIRVPVARPDVIMKAVEGRITWAQAADILRVTARLACASLATERWIRVIGRVYSVRRAGGHLLCSLHLS
jgi:hypothetical protein